MFTSKKNAGLSLIIHTKNEEKNISPCIDSAKRIADEILVVDMQSSDQTVEIAQKKGARIIKVKDFGFADPVRNYGISQAKFKWILYLDADERLPKSLLKKIVEIINEDKFDLVKFPRKNIIFKKWIRHGMWWPDYQLRLFKKGHLKYPAIVHTQPEYKGDLLTLPNIVENAIIHLHRNSIKEFLKMIDLYSSLDVKFKEEVVDQKKLTSDELINFINKEFKWRYFEQNGYLDGTHGFVINMFMNFYRFLEFAKYWENTGFKDLFNHKQLKDSINLYLLQESSEMALIKSSKFYKTWRIYSKLKELILRNK